MNRIILIGNGFDLAHGMKTSYKNFIDDFWKNKCEEIKNQKDNQFEDDFIKFNVPLDKAKRKTLVDFKSVKNINAKGYNLCFKNTFLFDLSDKNSLKNWVDIEDEYYQKLKEFSEKGEKLKLLKLNKEIQQISELLAEYLKRVEDNFDKSLYQNKIQKIKSKVTRQIDLIEIEQKSLKEIIKCIHKELQNKTNQEVIKFGNSTINKSSILSYFNKNYSFEALYKLLTNEETHRLIRYYPDNLMLLNFNYTDLHKLYESVDRYTIKGFKSIEPIKIHGCIHKPDHNPIIFGFGDELDKDYQAIEDLDDNDYLENIKSIKYLETDNYRKLLEFAESDKFQICIFGHSCGNSDRTLLNTLFEHDNCVSIKPYYYINEDGEDNYSQITRNISRNFKSKAKMRERVVNKTYTETLT